jgi:DNA-directed RNA polymerase specialized sigma24 family protein
LNVPDPQDQMRFETLVLPHLDAAFNLARWLLRSGNDRYTWLRANRPLQNAAEFDENLCPPDHQASNPEELTLQNDSSTLVRKALENLPTSFRKVLILRRNRGDVLPRDRRYLRYACGYRDVELIACARAPSSVPHKCHE